ncbi:uncharacterized protein LOC127719617 [Mytilus californianus]|uniref:uncharacterized protein LOC127719617 n=1 Tax=Mytilus californianus TaxID=6549 RepID=UPI0022486E36|nr:uncharacterized protein LOC127719617 [Mytilus californianus]
MIEDEVSKYHEYAKALRDQLENEKKRIENSITYKERQNENIKETLLNKQSKIQEVLESNHAKQVLKFSAHSECSAKDIPDLSFREFLKQTKEFIPIKLKTATNFFGSLHKTKLPKGLPQVNLYVIKSYTTDQKMVYRVLMIDDTTACISNHMTTFLHKINIDDTIKAVKDMSVNVNDMSITSSNDVLLSLSDGFDVCLLTTKTGEIKPFLSVPSMIPLGIHFTKQNEVILGVRERWGVNYNLTDKSCRKIIIFGMDGKQKQSYEYDKNKQRLFTFPAKIKSNVNRDILVIDKTSYKTGKVVVLDREGQIKWTYQGNPQINSGDKLFNPTDIVTTSVGLVIVSDVINHALHILSREGDLLIYKIMKDQGITYPVSLNIDTKGQLWVGCYSGNEQRTDAKLHVVKMSLNPN